MPTYAAMAVGGGDGQGTMSDSPVTPSRSGSSGGRAVAKVVVLVGILVS